MEELTNSVVIPAIVQNGVFKIWVNFEGDPNALKKEGMYIGYSDGVARVKMYEKFVGFHAWVAKYSSELMLVLAMLATFVLLAAYLLTQSSESDGSNSGPN